MMERLPGFVKDMSYEITLEENPSPEEIVTLHQGLSDFADAIFGPTVYKDITFFLRDTG